MEHASLVIALNPGKWKIALHSLWPHDTKNLSCIDIAPVLVELNRKVSHGTHSLVGECHVHIDGSTAPGPGTAHLKTLAISSS